MDVVVVGGGIVGLSSTDALAAAGADVTLCESDSLGTGSITRSAGGIRTQFWTRVNVRLSIESLRVWKSFEATFGVDIAHRRPGYLFLARTPETANRFRESVAMQRDLGVDSEFLSPTAAVERCPGLDPDGFVGATYNGADGFADPNLAVQGYATSAREAGIDVRTGTPVVDIVTDGGRVTGVETDAERIDTDFVVNAAGAWAATVADLAGVDLPIHPRRRQIAVVDPSRPVSADVPLTIDLEEGSYFRPERDGAALVGGHFAETESDADPDAYSDSMGLDWAATAVERAAVYTSYFDGDSRIRRGWAGLYAVTPDHHLIVEETIAVLVTAAGFSGHGFQHAPATGRLVAELCTDGEASLVDIEPLSDCRFEDDSDELVEQNIA